MQTMTLEAFFAAAEARARATGVADISVEDLRNKGGRRTETKRALLARAAERSAGRPTSIVSYY